jgi:AraC-like DNA-binding protein
MSSYTLYNKELNDIIAGRYFNKQNENHLNTYEKRSIQEPFGEFRYNVSNYNKICVSENRFSIQEDIKVLGEIDGELICLTFMLKGNSCFSCNSFRQSNLFHNSFNLFYLNHENNSKTECNKNSDNHLLEIYIAKDLFLDLCNKYPSVFHPTYNKIETGQSFNLFDNGKYISQHMHTILEQIRNAKLFGNVAPLLVEAKIMELFSIMLSNNTNEKENLTSKSLHEKMYEAKHLIEQNYNNPPCLNDLSKHLGICNTTLKKAFKEVFDDTIFNHLYNFRMEKAQHILKTNSNMNILDIALNIGYEHQANFSAAFKRKYGITPNQMKKKLHNI